MATKKVLLVGNGARGKTEWAKQAPHQPYIPTQGVEVHPVRSDDGVVRVKLWDCAGMYKYGGLRDGYYINADAALIFADNEKEAIYWAQEVLRVTPNIPIRALALSTNMGHFTRFPAIDKDVVSFSDILSDLFA